MIIEFSPEVAKTFLTWFCNQVKEVWGKMVQWISSKRDEIKAIMDEYMPVYDSPIHPAIKRIVLKGLIVKHLNTKYLIVNLN